MEIGEASEVLTLLAAAFPRRWRNAPAEETKLWIELLLSMDYAAARQTASAVIKSATDMPSVAEFRSTYRVYAPERVELPQYGHEHDPQSAREWEQAAERARLWRKEHYPNTKDPAEGKALPRNRRAFGLEWASWFRLHFGWSPPVASDEP